MSALLRTFTKASINGYGWNNPDDAYYSVKYREENYLHYNFKLILSSWRTANYDKEENCWRFCLKNVDSKVNSFWNDYI